MQVALAQCTEQECYIALKQEISDLGAMPRSKTRQLQRDTVRGVSPTFNETFKKLTAKTLSRTDKIANAVAAAPPRPLTTTNRRTRI